MRARPNRTFSKIVLVLVVSVLLNRIFFKKSENLEPPITQSKVERELAQKQNSTPKKLIDLAVERKPLPVAEAKAWEPRDYKVLQSTEGVVRISKGSSLLYSELSEIDGGNCGKGDSRRCILFPNGQKVVPSKELIPILPIRATWKARY